MKNHLLMVLVAEDTWKQIFRGTRDECMDKSIDIPDSESWMVVERGRQHLGPEKFTISKDDIQSIES